MADASATVASTSRSPLGGFDQGIADGAIVAAPAGTGHTYEGLMRRLEEHVKAGNRRGAFRKLFARFNPSKAAHRERVLRGLHAKLPRASHHQILQVLLFQELLAHQRILADSNASVLANGRRLQGFIKRWDRLKAQDLEFESESAALSRDVDEFVEKLAAYLHPSPASLPVTPSPASSSSNNAVSESSNPSSSADAVPPPDAVQASSQESPPSLSRRDAWALQRTAKSLISRSARFHTRLAAHERRKESAKGKGTACIAAIAQGGKDVFGGFERTTEVVLELVILWKNAKNEALAVEALEKVDKSRV